MLERGAVAGLNHLLSQQPLAAERLRGFAGKSIEIRCPPFPRLHLTVLENGMLERSQDGAESALVVKFKPAALPLLIARDETARGQIEIEGPADLAAAVDALFREISWDYEEDLSRVFGDVVAHRLATGGKAFVAWHGEALKRLAENLAEYWADERPLLVRPADAERFRADSDALRNEVARLEERIERLERSSRR
ncbi:MAG TPA: sterol-binding protein [Burkholderiales bacterium]|nr:sterol-binding protein [Burkholderiales bacterium]